MGAQKLNPEQFEYFGKFILLEKLADGGMAEVWLARTQNNRGITKFVAVKKILPHLMRDTDFVNMFLAEAGIVVNLSHPNIVTIYEFGEEQGQIYLAMDYVEGQNLNQLREQIVKSGTRLSQDHAIYIAKEAAAALAYAHTAIDKAKGEPLNVVHRDVSPENVMISFNGDVKLIDFGIAKSGFHRARTTQGWLKGKLGYLTPEQVDGKQADAKSDIFSLGICMWEMVTGATLFDGKTEFEFLNKVRECNIPLPSSLNPNVDLEMERIILKALASDPQSRFSSAEELHRELTYLLNKRAPAFSKNDFAQFVQSCFRQEVSALRAKLIDYSSLRIVKLNSAEPVVVEAPKPQKFPFKLLFLFILLLKTFFIYNIEYQRIVLATLPDKAKPIFLKFVEPFIDVHDEKKSEPIDPELEIDTKKYVKINGQFYEYNPDGIYIINNHKVYFRVKKDE